MNIRDEKKNRNRTRKIQINFRVDEDELKFIYAKMKALGIKNREAYLRKMAIDGQCIRNDYSEFEREMRKNNYLTSNIAKSLNQIAKRINSTGNFYENEISELIERAEIFEKNQRELMKIFLSVTKEK